MLGNIIPIQKPNNDTSYRPMSLLSVVANTMEKCFLPYIINNILNTTSQHGYKTEHSITTALHITNNTIAKGFSRMQPPACTFVAALDMSKTFDTVNIHTLIVKLLQTNKSHRPSSNLLQTISNDARITQHSENTHPQHANSKLACLKVAFSHLYFEIYTFECWQLTSTHVQHERN